MKIRQKLAILLAATMAFTAVPMVTMAKSDFGTVSGIKIAEKDDTVSNALRVEMKDATDRAFMFFVNLANAEFDGTDGDSGMAAGNAARVAFVAHNTANGGAAIRYTTAVDGKEMKVEVFPNGVLGDYTTVAGVTIRDEFTLPLKVKLKGGDATVAVDGAGSVVSDMSPVVIARTSDAKATVTVGDAETIYSDARAVAKITIDEPFKDVLTGGTNPNITFTIRHSDFKFSGVNANYTVTAERGFSAPGGAAALSAAVTPATDDGVVTFNPAAAGLLRKDASAPGRLTFVFELKSTEKKPATGDLNIKVSGDNVTSTTVKVAEVKDFGTIIEMKDKKVVDITAGHSEDLTFKVKEAVEGTFVAGREFDVQFDGAYLSPLANLDNTNNTNNAAGLNQKEQLIDAIDDAIALDVAADDAIVVVTDLITDDDDFVTGFTAELRNINPTLNDELEIEVKDLTTYVPLSASGEIKVSASGRALGYDASTVAVNAKKAVDVTMEPVTIKVGLKEQEGGKIVLKETDKGIFEQGEFIFINLEDEGGLTLQDEDFTEGDKIKVTEGDLVLDLDATEVNEDTGVLAIKVKRASETASTITIKDLKVYSNRTVPQGNYKFEVGGRALTEDWTLIETADRATDITAIYADADDMIDAHVGDNANDSEMIKPLEVKDFVIVATPNTEDITSNGLKKGTASFVIGSAKYIVNGVEASMDGSTYIADGRTMVPVRFVANALGVDGKDIYFAGGTATIIAGSKTVSLKVGSKTAMLNGVPAKTMSAAPVMKDGRTYVPVAEIGALLGVEATWDAATQTATFTNK